MLIAAGFRVVDVDPLTDRHPRTVFGRRLSSDACHRFGNQLGAGGRRTVPR
jgi:hypothetical protein